MRRALLVSSVLLALWLPQVSAQEPIQAPPAPAGEPGAPAPESYESRPVSQDGYTAEEIVSVGRDFFGGTTEGLAKVVERVFAEQGKPNAYIVGEEGSGAIGVGLRYGRGDLTYKDGASMPVFWQGPSIGWDFGGNASKVLTLVYKLRNTQDLFQRYPGVEGSLYFIAGVGVNYQRTGEITLAPIRTGVGLRAGANVGYLHYTPKQSWIPF